MNRRGAALLLTALALACAPAQSRQDNSIAAALNELQVRVERDVSYGPDARQRLDVYVPAAPKGPVLLFVHGGAWSGGDKRAPKMIVPKLRHFTARGFVVVSANYRLLPHAHPLSQARDVAMALAHVQRRAADWGADPARVVLMGHSAGAHLVTLVSSEPAFVREQGGDPPRAAVALDNPAFDVPAVMEAPHPFLYDRAFGGHAAYWRKVSPVHVVARDGAPLLAVCSMRSDSTCAQAEAFQRKASTRGVRVEVKGVDKTHAEIDRQLGLPGAYTDSVERWISSIL
jgi:arylformamidase